MRKMFLAALLLMAGWSAEAQVSFKGNVTQFMNAGRIVDMQEVVQSNLPYTKGKGAPFSIMIVPKSSDNYTEIFMVKGKLYQGDTVQNIPVSVNAWNSVALVELSLDNPTLFVYYNVYVGFGQDIDGL
jgi:hypothetical protein